MKIIQTVLILSAMSLFAYAKQSEEQTLTLDADSIKKLSVEAGAGDLSIRGDKAATKISIVATVVGDDIEADDYILTLTSSGSRAKLVAKIEKSYKEYHSSSYIDVEVIMPENLALSVEDGSGNTIIRDIVNDVEIDDGSGDLEIHAITGELSVDDGSGELLITTIVGDTEVEDGSGQLEIYTISGNLTVDDGSGDLTVETVSGNVEIEDGSGQINVANVTELVTVDDGSGDIRVSNVADLKIIDDGSGSVKMDNVGASTAK